jgi:hypothetical protein
MKGLGGGLCYSWGGIKDQVCHVRMCKINPFLFSSPCIRGIRGDCCIGWVGGWWVGGLGKCPALFFSSPPPLRTTFLKQDIIISDFSAVGTIPHLNTQPSIRATVLPGRGYNQGAIPQRHRMRVPIMYTHRMGVPVMHTQSGGSCNEHREWGTYTIHIHTEAEALAMPRATCILNNTHCLFQEGEESSIYPPPQLA